MAQQDEIQIQAGEPGWFDSQLIRTQGAQLTFLVRGKVVVSNVWRICYEQREGRVANRVRRCEITFDYAQPMALPQVGGGFGEAWI
jgi:hypothetical protein